MIASLTAIVVALTIGLLIFALGERVRERGERRLTGRNFPLSRKDIP